MHGYLSSHSSLTLSSDGCDCSCTECSSLDNTGLCNNRYRILQLLGQGSLGRTLLAIDQHQNSASVCVIKQLFLQNQIIPYPKALELFHQEAQWLAELGEHPQIPKLLNTFEQNGQVFIVQEWIDGWTLEQEVADAVPFDEGEIWKVLREVLPILQYLHAHQIIHRDIKPANIVRRRRNGQLVLVDFGAAKWVDNWTLETTGTMIGSAEYAAPEQVLGKPVFASDLYSLGVTCIYLLTQMSPFELLDSRDNSWVWRKYLNAPISLGLGRVLDKLLQPVTRWRYHSATEVLADLQAASASSASPCSADEVLALPNYSLTSFDPATQRWYSIPKKTEIPAEMSIPEDFTWKVAAFLVSRQDALNQPIPVWGVPVSTKTMPLQQTKRSPWFAYTLAISALLATVGLLVTSPSPAFHSENQKLLQPSIHRE
jgi:serine/threonine protein kinase